MRGLDIVQFIAENSGLTLSVSPVQDSERYFDALLQAGQVVTRFNKGKLVGVMAYQRVPHPSFIVKKEKEYWTLPSVYDKGPYLCVDHVVVREDMRSRGVLPYFIQYIRNITPKIHAAFWELEDGHWSYQERAENMQNNCGIVAFDKIAGMLHGRANVISLASLARIAQDNDFLLYPLEVKRSDILDLTYPYVLHLDADFHFETIRTPQDLAAFIIPEKVYVLASDVNVGEVLDEDVARKVRGSGKKFFKEGIAPVAGGALGGFLVGGPAGAAAGAAGAGITSATGGYKGGSALGNATKAGIGGAVGVGVGKLAGGLMSGGGSSVAPLTGVQQGTGASMTTTGNQVVGKSSGGFLANTLGKAGALFAPKSTGTGGSNPSPASQGGTSTPGGGFQVSSLLNKENIGLGLGLGAQAIGSLRSNAEINIPQANQEAVDLAKQRALSGGLTPASQAAQTALKTGIEAGPAGIYAPANDAYFQAAQREQRYNASLAKESKLQDINRIGGGVYSSDAMQQMNRFDMQQQQASDDFATKYLEGQRAIGVDAHIKYIGMALEGDRGSYEELAKALGSYADADRAIQLYQAGIQNGGNQGMRELGTGLITNYFGQRLQPAGV